jgi:cobalt/nickel transport system permease protein
MAHVVDGILSTPVIVAGTAMAAVGIAVGLRRVDGVRLPYCGLMGAAFFVASLVHVPLGPSNAHLILNGLLGIVLGLAALPAIFVGLFLQALFFGYGGITVLGVNTIVMGVPAIICHYLFGPRLRRQEDFGWLWGAAVGGSAIALTCAGLGASLALSGREFLPAAQLLFVAHLPVLAVEAAITGTIVVFLQRVKPEVLMMSWELPSGRPARA